MFEYPTAGKSIYLSFLALNLSESISMADLAEAVVRGDILVDEIDVIEAVEKGRLSASDGARFSAILEEYSKSHKKLSDPCGKLESAQNTLETTRWDKVLVDEVDFIDALKIGRVSKDDSHIASINKEVLKDSTGDTEEAKISFHDEILTDDEKMSDASSSIDILI
uniref:Bm10566 n=2 Tax=Brugia malayi TaxID=6279 RepID=A0A0H5SA83_BRUMA|nr:Bm10566 [Brugia malayi]